jgi:hypothetical protein
MDGLASLAAAANLVEFQQQQQQSSNNSGPPSSPLKRKVRSHFNEGVDQFISFFLWIDFIQRNHTGISVSSITKKKEKER